MLRMRLLFETEEGWFESNEVAVPVPEIEKCIFENSSNIQTFNFGNYMKNNPTWICFNIRGYFFREDGITTIDKLIWYCEMKYENGRIHQSNTFFQGSETKKQDEMDTNLPDSSKKRKADDYISENSNEITIQKRKKKQELETELVSFRSICTNKAEIPEQKILFDNYISVSAVFNYRFIVEQFFPPELINHQH